MPMTDFEYEFYAKVSVDEDLQDKVERRLRELAEGHNDLIGAAVAVEEEAHGETGHWFRARIVTYVKQENLVAVEKADTVRGALNGALQAIERQIREHREKLRNY